MFTLSNLKTGQTKVIDDVTVTKEDGHYRVTTTQGTAQLRFLVDARQWRFVIDGDHREHQLPDGTTGKTAIDELIANWPAKQAVEDAASATPKVVKDEREVVLEKIQKLLAAGNDTNLDAAAAEAYLGKAASLMAKHLITDEEIRRAEGGTAGSGDDEIITWSFSINTQGGHATHRAAAFMSVIRAFGAGTFFTHYRSQLGYKEDDLQVYVIAQEAVVTKIKDFIVIMDLAMERQAAEVSRRVSAEVRASGGHHSLGRTRGPGSI